MADIYLPTLHSFAMGNTFTGSCGMLRFRIVPDVVKIEGSKEIDFAGSSIHAQLWHGIFCYEKSTVEQEKEFPMTKEGREELKSWLEANV